MYHYKAELIGFNMVHEILKLDEDKWTKFEFIHYYPGNFSLFLFLLDYLGLLSIMNRNFCTFFENWYQSRNCGAILMCSTIKLSYIISRGRGGLVGLWI